MFWLKLLTILSMVFLGWYLYRYVKSNPESFSAANLNKSIFTLGILALFLIGFIMLCVLFLKY